MKVILFSGFLGEPSDWDFLRPDLRDFEIEAHVVEPRSGWQETCQQWVKTHVTAGQKPLLIGYSLGGRMAVQLAIGWPELFSGLIAMSTHTGLKVEQEKLLRIDQDRIWADRFSPHSQEGWESLLQSWDSQSVFGSTPETRARPETAALRLRCERQLRNLSLGLQSDLREMLVNCPLPQTWITGKEDLKCDALAKDLSFRSLGKIHHISVNNQGHRWPWTASASHVGPLIRENILKLNLLKKME